MSEYPQFYDNIHEWPGAQDPVEFRRLVSLIPEKRINARFENKPGHPTLLHQACKNGHVHVVRALLCHPHIDVNSRDGYEGTPFITAAEYGQVECFKLLLDDDRVLTDASDKSGSGALYHAAEYNFLNIIKWWVASGKVVDFGEPFARNRVYEVAERQFDFNRRNPDRGGDALKVKELLPRIEKERDQVTFEIQREFGLIDRLAGKSYALVVFVSDGLLCVDSLQHPKNGGRPNAVRFFKIARKLPLELQMLLCLRCTGATHDIIPCKETEAAFKSLAEKLK